MLALTILQPWAYAIRHLGKDIENRMWTPPAKLIGERFCIHAGQFKPTEKPSAHNEKLAEALSDLVAHCELRGIEIPEGHNGASVAAESGAIVAVATLDSVVMASDSPWFVGKFGWVLRDVVNIEPVPMRGAQKLWTVPQEQAAIVRERFEAARRRAA